MTESSRLLRERRLSWELGRCLWHAAPTTYLKIVIYTHSGVVVVLDTCMIVTSHTFLVLQSLQEQKSCLHIMQLFAQSVSPSMNLIFSNKLQMRKYFKCTPVPSQPSQENQRHSCRCCSFMLNLSIPTTDSLFQQATSTSKYYHSSTKWCESKVTDAW